MLPYRSQINDAPQITSAAPTAATEGVEYTYNPTVSDPDNTTFIWSLTNAPTGMVIDSGTGAVTWTPGAGVTTSGVVTLRVDDLSGGTATELFLISVTP